MDLTQFILQTAVERARHSLRHKVHQLNEKVDAAIEKLPDELEKHPCTGDLLCQRQKVRHRADCIGKTPPFDAYARELGSIQ